VAEKIILVCNVPNCPTPEVNVKRCTSTIDKVTVDIDLCDLHRKPIEELRGYANPKRSRRRGRIAEIRVVDPGDIPRK
jgi:hypothetical protein